MHISLRKFQEKDIANKVKWINNPENNRYLHYDLPLECEKTKKWYDSVKDRTDRYDAVIEVDGKPVGIIGLLSIDIGNSQAEYYITIGERSYTGKGVAASATKVLLRYAFDTLNLARIYLYTESENLTAQRFFERVGFQKEGLLQNHLFYNGRFVDRYIYGLSRNQFIQSERLHSFCSPIQTLGQYAGNQIYIMREDLIPFSFGGNKARKASLFFEEIDRNDYDVIVTYGSSSSNHCRIIANMAAQRGLRCIIITPNETDKPTQNSEITRIFGANIINCPVSIVSDTIKSTLDNLVTSGHRPYFIPGGGHSNIGTQAYVNCYQEICDYEFLKQIHFDYIFFASGTGTTQAGLVCGKLLQQSPRQIIGISIARRSPYGRNIIINSIKDFFAEKQIRVSNSDIENATIFVDDYIAGGYGMQNPDIENCIRDVLIQHGIPLDPTYTGKAFDGTLKYLKQHCITSSNVLFIHTGGTPLFFDALRSIHS